MGTLSNKYFNAQAVGEALDKGVAAYDNMGQIELVYNGTDIRFNNEVVNFQQIVDYITTDARFCYMVYNNRVLLTSDMQLTGGTRYIFFETSTTDSGLSKNTVVKVYSSDGTAISSISYSTIANENFSNKVSTIADNDKNSTVHYPSNKAVTEITDEIKEDLSEVHDELGFGVATFSISNGGEHSSTKDRIRVNLKQGEKFTVEVRVTNNDEYKANGTVVQYNGTDSTALGTAYINGGIKEYTSVYSGLCEIGVYHHATSNVDIQVVVSSTNSVLKLNNKVVTLREDLLNLGHVFTVDAFEQGSWEDFNKVSSSLRIRIKSPIFVNGGEILYCTPNNQFYDIAVYDDAGTLLYVSGWTQKSMITIPVSGYLILMVANGGTYGTSTAIVPSDYNMSLYLAYSNIKELTNEVFKHLSTLDFDISQGTIYNGNLVDDKYSVAIAEYFPIGSRERKLYMDTGYYGDNLRTRITFYDNSKTYISHVGYSVYTNPITAPDNASYYRLSFNVFEGNTPTEITPEIFKQHGVEFYGLTSSINELSYKINNLSYLTETLTETTYDYLVNISGNVLPLINGNIITINSSGVTVLGKGTYGKAFTKEEIVEQIGNKAAITDSGFTIDIGSIGCLYYDKVLEKFGVSNNANYPKGALILLANWYGNFWGAWLGKIAYENSKQLGSRESSYLLASEKALVYPTGTNDITFSNGSNGALIVNIKSSSNQITVISHKGSIISKTFDNVVADLPDKASIDSTGVLQVTIGNYSAFTVSYEEKTFRVKSISALNDNDIVLVMNTWNGALRGQFYDQNIRKQIIELSNKPTDTLPDYVVNEINDTRNKISELNSNNFNYIILTDIHYSHPDFTESNLDNLMKAVKKIAESSNVDAVVCLGDLIEGGKNASKDTSKNQMSAIAERIGDIKKPILWAMGNHDTNAYDWWRWESDIKNTSHYITTDNFINIAERPFGHYSDAYYMDFPSKNMRFIIANTCDYKESIDNEGNITVSNYSAIMVRDEQISNIEQWVSESPYNVIIGTHGIATNLINTVKYINEHPSEYNNRKVMLYNTGHYHNDALEYVSEYSLNLMATDCTSMAAVQRSATNTGQGPIGTSWLNDGTGTSPKNPARVKDTISDYLFDVVSIGADKITRIRFGAGEDGELQLT